MSLSDLGCIRDFLLLSPVLATAGQPTTEQFPLLRAAGFDTVINLAAWPISPESLEDEDIIVEELGMEYVPIPVRWQQPTPENLQTFFDTMDARKESQRLFIHCIANKRVSAFLYLYRVLKEGIPVETAQADMRRIWTPEPWWQEFIDASLFMRP